MDLDPIQSITSEDDGKTFTVPESRIGNAADARNIVAGLQRAELTRSSRRAKINGLLNGNRPWNQATLQSKGQGERTNLNLREAEGFVAAAKTPYYDLFREVDRYAQFTLDYGDEPIRQEEWADKVATRYHYALDSWDGLEMAIQRSQYQMVVHGAGPMVWEDARDWRSKSRMAGQILVPDDASADIEEWETCAVPRSYLPSQLWEKIKNESVATAGKWNVPAVKRAIMNAAPEEFQKSYGFTWEFYEAEIRKGSAGWNSRSKRIFVHALFQKEFSGQISHFIILESTPQSTGADTVEANTSKDPMTGFLFRKIGKIDCFTQIVNGFLYDVGPDGQWHSVKGAGPKIFDFCEVSNRLTCRIIDGAIVASGFQLTAKDGNALQQTAVTHVTGGVVYHPDYKVEQNRLGDNLQSPLLVKRDLKSILHENTGQYRQRPFDAQPLPTLGQEQLNAAQEAVLGKGDVNRYYRSLDAWHRETFRRLLAMGEKLYAKRKNVAPDVATVAEYQTGEKGLTPSERGALKFYQGCIEDEVPEEVLKYENFCRIKATRSVGYGSAQMRMMIGEKFVAALGTMDERGRNTALRMWASSLGGQNVADQLYPRYDIPQLNDDHMALATLENNALRVPGDEVLITPRQDHVIHFQFHAQGVGKHAQEVQSGQGDPESLLVHLHQAGPHMHQHLMAISGDPTRKDQFDQMMKVWLGMSKMADQLQQQVDEAKQAGAQNQPQQMPDPKLLAALAQVHANADIKREGMLLDNQRKQEKQSFQMRLKELSTAHSMRLKNAQAQPEMSAAA